METGEDAARMRVNRALGKLRKYFMKRGVVLTTAIIAGTISANSVQAAPAALARPLVATAVAKGAGASGPTLTLVKGALKLMAWTKAKTAIFLTTVAIVGTGTTAVIVEMSQLKNESIDAKIARLSNPGTTEKEAIRVLGAPTKYAAGDQMLDKNHLPTSHLLVYSEGIQVRILRER